MENENVKTANFVGGRQLRNIAGKTKRQVDRGLRKLLENVDLVAMARAVSSLDPESLNDLLQGNVSKSM